MMYIQSKCRGLAGLLIAATFFVACNSNHSSEKMYDTASTATYSSPDTMQSSVPADTTSAVAPATTPATKSQETVTKTKEVIVKKKVKVIVEAPPVVKHPRVIPDNEGIYEYSEVTPTFPGGRRAIEYYVTNNIEYPQTALDYNKEGRIGVSFIVNEKGDVTNVHTVGSKLGDGLDEEAVRVVSSMPKWNPGTVRGRPVRTRVTLPITFKIES